MTAINIPGAPAFARPQVMPGTIERAGIVFGPLGSLEFRTNGAASLEGWRGVVKRVKREQAMYDDCLSQDARCPAAVHAWRQKLAALRGEDRISQLAAINRFINHASRYSEDIDHFGRADVWETPAEFLSGSGDCEDYAIAKFFSLLELGFSNDQLRIVVVHDRQRNVDHAVVAVAQDGDTYILDSLSDAPVRHERLLKYDPVYSVNLTSRWGHIVTPQIRSRFMTYVAQRDRSREQKRLAAAMLPAHDEGSNDGTVMVSDVIGDLKARLWPAETQPLIG